MGTYILLFSRKYSQTTGNESPSSANTHNLILPKYNIDVKCCHFQHAYLFQKCTEATRTKMHHRLNECMNRFWLKGTLVHKDHLVP